MPNGDCSMIFFESVATSMLLYSLVFMSWCHAFQHSPGPRRFMFASPSFLGSHLDCLGRQFSEGRFRVESQFTSKSCTSQPHLMATTSASSAAHALNSTDIIFTDSAKLLSTDNTGSLLQTEDSDAASSATLAIDPSTIEIVPVSDKQTIHERTEATDPIELPASSKSIYPFVEMLRESAPYISDHRDELAVIHISGEMIEWDGFPGLMDDIALAWLLGMKIVLVVGCRSQVECRLSDLLHGHDCQNSLRVTDKQTLRLVEEEAGYVRFEVERQLNRCLRLHGGAEHNAPGGPPAPDGNVIGGHLYTAKAIGVQDDVDYEYAGYPCHVEVEKIMRIHKSNDIVLLTTMASDRTGERLTVNSESLASFVASALKSTKLIYCSEKGYVLRNKKTKNTVQNFQLSFAKSLLRHHDVKVHKKGFATLGSKNYATNPGAEAMLFKIGWVASAIQKGVKRAHIVGPTNGALLQELYTARDGSSTCISQDGFESVHPNDEFDDDEVGEFDGTFFQNFLLDESADEKHVIVASTPAFS